MAKAKEMMEDVDNVGIMQGFLDEMEDDMEEEVDGEEENSAAKMLDRRPGSPEILMNTLRGDMRSVDARREELADLVGYAAASETPDSVLAMLQPVLAQQGGLGALPQSVPMAQGPQAPMMPPMPPMAPPAAGAPPMGGMPPPNMAALLAGAGGPPAPMPPPGPMMGPDGMPIPPEGMPPIRMNKGGIVQRFQDGSDEEAVTPVGEEDLLDEDPRLSSAGFLYSPELVALAQSEAANLLKREPQAVPTLKSAMEQRLPEYQQLLGIDPESSKAGFYFDLAQAGLNLAANRGPRGERLSGSGLSRFAGAFSGIPAAMQKRVGEIDTTQRQLKLLALQAGEKDRDQIQNLNTKLDTEKRSMLNTIVRADAQRRASEARGAGAIFGKGGLGPFWNVITSPGMAQAYADGALTPDEDNMFLTAANRILADARPRTEVYKDALGRDVSRQIPGYELPWLTEALAQRQQLDAMGGPRPAPTPGTIPLGPEVAAPAGGEAADVGVVEGEAAVPQETVEQPAATRTFWERAPSLATVELAGATAGQTVPGGGQYFSQAQQDLNYYNSTVRDLIRALAVNPRFPVSEMEQIRKDLNLDPKILRDTAALRNAFIGIDDYLTERRIDAIRAYNNEENTPELRKASLDAAVLIEDFQRKLMPPRITSREQYEGLPIGAKFLGWDPDLKMWAVETKKPPLSQ